jgi:hypothetical protein
LYHPFKEELTQIHLKLFQITESERIFPNSFHEANIILILKPNKDIYMKRKIEAYIPDEPM